MTLRVNTDHMQFGSINDERCWLNLEYVGCSVTGIKNSVFKHLFRISALVEKRRSTCVTCATSCYADVYNEVYRYNLSNFNKSIAGQFEHNWKMLEFAR